MRIYEFEYAFAQDWLHVSNFDSMKVVRGILGLLWKLYILVVFSVTAVLFYPFIVLLLLQEKTKNKAMRLFVYWSWIVCFFCLYFIKRIENHPLPDGPFIIVANHASYLDIFLMPSLFPNTPFIFLGKSEILRYPLIKTYFKRLHIPVFRDNKLKAARSVIQAIEQGRKGRSLVIFPEGGIPDEPHPFLGAFKPGAFQIAKGLGFPIVPLTFVNNFKLFSDPEHVLGPAGPGVSKVHIHPFIPKEEVEVLSLQELSERSRATIHAALKQHYPEMN